ncbi:MAG: TolC family protein [Planctomycetes bacterium]|nr:TolC family protein [Planctomycetota bacterium]
MSLVRGLLLFAALAVTACASQRERDSYAAWDDLAATFRPLHEAPAAITSATRLEDYVRIALERNRSIQADAERWRAGLARIPQARSLPDPTISYGGFIERVETRIGPQRHRVGLMQRVPWPGKLTSASAQALEEAEAGRARTDATRLRVVFEVRAAYADYYYLARELAITRQTLELVRHWEAIAQTRFRTGARAAYRDVVKAQVEIGRLEDRASTLLQAREPRSQRLRELLDLPVSTQLPWPRPFPARAIARSDDQVRHLLHEHSPRLRDLSLQIAARERGVDRAQQSYFPDFSFGFDYIEVGPARNSGVTGSGDDAIVGKLGLSLPIWFGRNAASVSEARARLRAAELDRHSLDNRLQTGLTRGLFAYHDSERKLSLYRDSLIPKGEESLQTAAAAFESGEGDFLSVLDAERVLLEFHLSRERALVDRETSLSNLEMLTGADLGEPTGEDAK